jgi:hypothetical protein
MYSPRTILAHLDRIYTAPRPHLAERRADALTQAIYHVSGLKPHYEALTY